MKLSRLLCGALALLLVASTMSYARDSRAEIFARNGGLVDAKSPEASVLMTKKVGTRDRILGANYQVFDSVVNGFSYYNNTQIPFDWDPNSGLLLTAKRGGINDDPVFNRNNGFIRYSTDMGATWEDPLGPIQDDGDPFQDSVRYPNIAFHSPNGALGFEDLIVFHANPFVNESWGHYGVGVTFGDFPDPFTVSIPPFNIDGQDFDWLPNTVLTSNPSGTKIIVFVPLDAPETALPEVNSNIGMISFLYDTENPVASVLEPFSTAPWTVPTDIQNPDGSITAAEDQRSNRLIQAGWDIDGSLYVGAIGQLAANESGAWDLPMIIKSDDEGDTWSEWDFLPESQFINFLVDLGAFFPSNRDYFLLGQDMTVLGPNHVIVFTSMVDATQNGEQLDRMLEFEYLDGTWTIRTVGPQTGTFVQFYHDQEEFETLAGTQPQTLPEVQISPTADGEWLVAKWVDLVGYLFEGEETARPAYDIFFTIREVNDGFWREPVNITESWFHDKLTWIPRMIPSIDEVPMLASVSALGTNDWFSDPNNPQNPDDSIAVNVAQQMIFDNQHIVFTTFNLRGLVSGVDEFGNYVPDVTITSVSPNPVNNVGTVKYELPEPGQVSVHIYDGQGRKLMTLLDKYHTPGEYTANFNLADRPNGSYFVNISFNGETATTKQFVVLR